jgi:trans-aconitate methyltransferase
MQDAPERSVMAKADELPEWDSWAEYYDRMDADREPMIAFYRSLVKESFTDLLELGSGTGRVASALADVRPALQVIGVDKSPKMVDVAKKRDPRCQWLVADMKHLSLRQQFDMIICCYNTLQQILDDGELVKMFGSVKRQLKSGGIFAFDIYEPNPDYLRVDRVDRLVRSVTNAEGRTLEIREDARFDPSTAVYSIHWKLISRAVEIPVTEIEYHYRQYSSSEINNLLHRADLKIIEQFSDFDRSPPGYGPKQVIVAATT